MLLHDAIAGVGRGVVGDDDGATYFDVTHVVGGVAHRKGGPWIAGDVAQLLFARGCRKQDVVAVEQKPQGSTLRTAVGEQCGENPGVGALKNFNELWIGR